MYHKSRDSHRANRSVQRIPNHSLQKSSKPVIIVNPPSLHRVSSLTQKDSGNVSSSRFQSNQTTNNQNNAHNTPGFSPTNSSLLHKQATTKMYRNQDVYKLLESIKLSHNNHNSASQHQEIVTSIRERLGQLLKEDKSQSKTISKEVECINSLLNCIETKLIDPVASLEKTPHPAEDRLQGSSRRCNPNLNSIQQISPIRGLSPMDTSSKIVYTNLNLQALCEEEEKEKLTSEVNIEDVDQNVGNIEYYKIMHMLGEKVQITPRKSQRSMHKEASSTQRESIIKEEDMTETMQIAQLSMELEMLEDLLKKKRSGSQPPEHDEAAGSLRRSKAGKSRQQQPNQNRDSRKQQGWSSIPSNKNIQQHATPKKSHSKPTLGVSSSTNSLSRNAIKPVIPNSAEASRTDSITSSSYASKSLRDIVKNKQQQAHKTTEPAQHKASKALRDIINRNSNLNSMASQLNSKSTVSMMKKKDFKSLFYY